MRFAVFNRRWSTLSLLGISAGLSSLAYFGGRAAASRQTMSASETDPPARSTALVGTTKPEQVSKSKTSGFDDRWTQASTTHRTPASERDMAAALEELATHDPKRALTRALGEGNFRLRQNLRNAVLRGWATVSPDEAATWALALPEGDRQLALGAVFEGAAKQPEEAAKLATRLCSQDPALAGDYGQFLITGLSEAGAYENAVQFAITNNSAHHSSWLNAAFFQWSSHQPEQALAAFGKISDPAARMPAFQGLILGWSMANPAAVAAYAANLAPGENRAEALSQALPQWANVDPVSASEWMVSHFDPSPDLDAGVAAVATMPNLLNARPEVAVGWAESIAEPVLRANTLRMISQQWAQRDSGALRRFVASTPDLPAIDRSALLDGLNPPPDM